MAYKPSAAAFEDIDDTGTYKPNAAAFEEEQDPMQVRDEKIREMGGFKGLAAETLLNLSDAMKSSVLFARDLPNKLEKSGKYIEENPGTSILHNVGQIGAGAADLGKSLINSGSNLNEFLSHKFQDKGNLNPIEKVVSKLIPDISGIIPHIPDTGIENILGLEADNEKGDDLIRAIPSAFALGLPGALNKIKGIGAGTKPAKVLPKHLEAQISKERNLLDITGKRLDKFKEALESSPEYRSAKPSTLRRTAGDLEAKVEQELPNTMIPEREIGEIPAAPDTKAIVTERKEAAKRAQREAEETLGVLDHPRLKGGAIVQKAIKDVKKSASDLYDSARSHYVDKKIMADNSKEIKSVTSDLEALKASDDLAPTVVEQEALESQISALQGEQVNASDVFDLQRTLEKMAEDTRKKQYSGVNEIEFKRLSGIAQRLDSHADKLASRLEEVGGKDVQSMMKQANKGWKTFKELERNSTARPALKKGELPSRAMIDIANTESGNEFLRSLTETYPELKKHMLAAHVGESSVNKLLKPNSLTKSYLKALPEVEDKVMALKDSIAGIKEGETKAVRVKKEYDDLVDSMKNAANQQKLRQDAIANVEKYQGLADKRTKAADIVKRKIDKAKSRGENIKSLEAELKTLEADRAKFKNLLKTALKLAYQYGGIKSAIGR